MPVNQTFLIVEKTGSLKEVSVKSINKDEIYKKCGFSEFNIMGSYALKNNKNISFVFSKEKNYNFKKQFWSHTPKNELINQIKNII